MTAKAKASKAEIYAAFDACTEKVEKQLRRYKRKIKGHHKDRNQSVEFIDSTSYTPVTKEGDKDSAITSGPMIVAETERTFPVFSVKAASEELEKSNLPFLLFKTKENVFILRTFSKIYGLSSLRVGWGYGSKKIINALNIIKPPFNVNEVAQKAAVESLKDNKFISRSIKHNIFYATKLRDFLNNYDISSNNVTANFLLLDFAKCKLKAKYFYKKLKMKGIILRSTEDGYKMKNMLRLTIGSKKENLEFMKVTKNIFKK